MECDILKFNTAGDETGGGGNVLTVEKLANEFPLCL